MKKVFYIVFIPLCLFITLDALAQKINPGDGVRIAFLDIGDVITGDYFIQPNGLLNLPQIGIINTTNKDFSEIKTIIESRYDSLYKDPHLSINALFRINILGEVENPGFYFVSDSERFTAILAFAGGPTETADLSDILLVRDFESIEMDVESIIQEGRNNSDFGLQSGDQIYVPRRWWADNSGVVTTIISIIALAITSYAVFFQ